MGSFKYGKAPFVAQEDHLESDKWNRESVEMRWEPKDAEKDHATSDDIFRNLGTTSPYHPAYDLFRSTTVSCRLNARSNKSTFCIAMALVTPQVQVAPVVSARKSRSLRSWVH